MFSEILRPVPFFGREYSWCFKFGILALLITSANSKTNCGISCEYSTSVRYADCSENDLVMIPSSKGCSGAEHFDMDGNLIEQFTTDDLSGYESVRSLDLSRNRLSSLNNGSLCSCSKLEYLYLSSMNITNLTNEVFKGLNYLIHLYIDQNRIGYIEDQVFSNLENIQLIHLGYNRITSLANVTFIKNLKLKYLYLLKNRITFIDQTLFNGLTKLSVIDLSHNLLTLLHLQTFAKLRNLQTLKLSFNQIVDIYPAQELPSCRLLLYNLKNNNLSDISCILPFLQNETSLDISENPLHCDCKLETIRKWVQNREKNEDEDDNSKCMTPDEYHQMSLMDLPQLECSTSTTSQSDYKIRSDNLLSSREPTAMSTTKSFTAYAPLTHNFIRNMTILTSVIASIIVILCFALMVYKLLRRINDVHILLQNKQENGVKESLMEHIVESV